jgi:hypothetical protein
MEIHKRREKIAFRSKVNKALEPVFVVITLLVFAFPVIAVLNLSPLTKSASNVLGVSTTANPASLIEVIVYEENQSVNSMSSINAITDRSYRFNTTINHLREGTHRFEGFEIKNISNGEVKVTINGSMESNSNIEIGYLNDNSNQILQRSDGTVFNKEVIIPSGLSKEFTFYIKNTDNTNFYDKLTINISAVEYGN